MRAKLWCLLSGATLLLLLVTSAEASVEPEPTETFPLSEVKPGQKGYGLTTIRGTTPERFEFEVLGVLRNFLPKLDIILIKSDDEKFAVSGFWQGMSGSPLFIDGKLACAFSYGFRFSEDAIGGCTPIEPMRREGFRPPRDSARQLHLRTGDETAMGGGFGDSPPRAEAGQSKGSLAEWRALTPDGTLDTALSNLGSRHPWRLKSVQDAAPALELETSGPPDLVPAAVPLAVSGFSAPAFEAIKDVMGDYPIEPMQSGGTGAPTGGPSVFQSGGPISIQLIRGDMSAAATCTVSYVESDRVLACGHPLFQAGELYAPVAAAEVHTVMPSARSSFVIASPLRELGTLVHDRKSTIMASTRHRTDMVPVHVRLSGAEGALPGAGDFDVEVLSNRFFTPRLAHVAVLNAMTHFLPDRDHVSARVVSRAVIAGHGDLEYVDYLHSSDGAAGLVGDIRGLRVLVPLMMNPFGPVEIERLEIDVEASYAPNYADIEAIRLPAAELIPGETSHVTVEMSTHEGERIVEKIPFTVPERLAGSLARLEVTAGSAAPVNTAPPASLDDLIAGLRKLLPGDVFAVTLYGPEEGAAIDGQLIRDLPPSLLDKLKTSTETPPGKFYSPHYRALHKTNRVLRGRRSLRVRVAPRR